MKRDIIKELELEEAEIAGKLDKLINFIDTELYFNLTKIHQNALLIQSALMEAYSNILLTRIELLKEELN